MDPSNSPPTASSRPRRSSLVPGSSFFRATGSTANMSNQNQNGSPPYASPIASVAANAQSNQRRRLSITTLGLSGSPTQTSPFTSRPFRQGSISSSVDSTSGLFEDAIDDGENTPPNNPSSPFARRVSFGAQALREVRGGGPNGEGFNWSEALRTRAERAPSMGGMFSLPSAQQQSASQTEAHHHRAASIAIMEQPTEEMRRPVRQNKPDFFQEKILRADFME